MSNPPNPDNAPSLSYSVPLSQAETDTLLEKVNQQRAEQTLDSSDRELLQRMVECLGDSRGLVRLGFAEALGSVGKPATPFLVEALARDPNPVIRRAAAKTLTLIADPAAIPTLLDALLNDEDTVVKSSSVGALARIGREAVPELLAILASSEHSESNKGHAAWALAFIGAEAKELIYQAITSDSAEVRAAVVGAIANITAEHPEEGGFKILMEALSDRAANVRSEAAAALGKLAHKPAIPPLIELLGHGEGESRKSAALALMKIGDRVALDPLRTALNQEPEEGVQKAIALAISQIERRSEEEEDEC